jgi:cysteine-rich repeat protein
MSSMQLRPFWSLFLVLAITSIGCGGGNKNQATGGSGGNGGGTTSKGDAGETSNGENTADGGGGNGSETCGNGKVDGLEECDDRNSDDEDGCTSLCEFSCHEDTDCESDPCNAGGKCDVEKTHACIPGAKTKDNGESCGDNAECYEGKCHVIACGDKIAQKGEDCDDGNTDDSDGCTKECHFTCVAGNSDDNVINLCDPNATCDETTHTWKSGTSLPDNTLCGNGEGYCLNGVCHYSTCGDGKKEPNEECDLGDQNGKPGSECLTGCTKSVCGNGKIESDEQCDDGNQENSDGCDSHCKAELIYRLQVLHVTRDPAPSFCKHANNENQGNAMGKLFANDTMVTTVQSLMGGQFTAGNINLLIYIMDLDDPSAKTPDPLVGIGMATGVLDADWTSQTDKLDFPVKVNPTDLNDDNLPKNIIPSELIVENGKTFFRTTAAVSAGYSTTDGAQFSIFDAMMSAEVDPARSKPPAPPEFADSVQLPESSGGTDTEPTGYMCGVLLASNFESIPMPDAMAVLCIGMGFRSCSNGQDPTKGECDSILTMFQKGCPGMMNAIGEPDADVDGDGKNEGYTSVVYFSEKRVKLTGVAPP